ncbi:unnamed protein product [Hymenolepis diminuta]|uniref:DUF5709 domain-containing protein n=1 Tax=Hymenolepis diminuta TaxID=6216 RepID=A0A0R3SYR8_HYMDI|nr:unnamed protein product [Hymenolepis diminuta]
MTAATSCQHLEQSQPLECIVEDSDETSALDNDYERPNETLRRTDELQEGGISTVTLTDEDYLEPRENVEGSDK